MITETNLKTEINKKIAIITCCIDDWGGSEELWARSIPHLNIQAKNITLFKDKINHSHPEILALNESGLKFKELAIKSSILKRVYNKIKQRIKKLPQDSFHYNPVAQNFFKNLQKSKPDLVVIAQGINFDGLIYAQQCLLLNIPYVIIVQKAVDFYWPYPTDRVYMRNTLLEAEQIIFVSQHNQNLTEEQFGVRLPNSKVLYNPNKTVVKPIPYPSVEKGLELACVARLFIIDKGQDILLRILSSKKWRSRPITVSFIGSGHDEEGLKELANLLKLENVRFKGFESNIEKLWEKYHALLLPSRSEGLPLSMIEAMSLGRAVIVTKAGGNNEIINDGVNGFIGNATEEDFGEAMERAWLMKDKWESIGISASEYIKYHFPKSPEKNFADYINNLLK